MPTRHSVSPSTLPAAYPFRHQPRHPPWSPRSRCGSTREISSFAPTFSAATVSSSSSGRHSGIDQRAEEHVAADAGKTIEVGNRMSTSSAALRHKVRKTRTPTQVFIIGNAALQRQTCAARALCYNHCFFNSLEDFLVSLSQNTVLAQHVREFLRAASCVSDLPRIVIEQPPKVELGEFAFPLLSNSPRSCASRPARSPKRSSTASGRSRALRNWKSPRRATSTRE